VVTIVLNLVGAAGALPPEITRRLGLAAAGAGPAAQELLDGLTHRLLVRWYRAWERRLPVARERWLHDRQRGRDGASARADVFTRFILQLVGLTDVPGDTALGFDADTLVGYASLLAQLPRSAAGLQALLADYFRVPVRVRQLQPGWVFHETNHGPGLFRDLQARFRVVLGPLSHARFRSFLPSERGGALPALLRLTRLYVGAEFDFEVQLVLRAAEVPASRMDDPEAVLALSFFLAPKAGAPAADAEVLIDAEQCRAVERSWPGGQP
jgi:type VI secretion system protein ImpH